MGQGKAPGHLAVSFCEWIAERCLSYRARMVSDWYSYSDVFVWVLDIITKRPVFNRRPQEFWSVDTLPTSNLRDWLWPHTEESRAKLWHAFARRHFSYYLLESKLQLLSRNKMNKKMKSSFSLISFWQGDPESTQNATAGSIVKGTNVSKN